MERFPWSSLKGCAILFSASLSFLGGSSQLYAQHYPAGSEGIKAGSLPPPGLYFKDYNSFYTYNEVPDFYNGQELTSKFIQFDYVQALRPIWITPFHFLGADFGMAARIPFEYQQFTHSQVAGYVPGFPGLPSGPATITSVTERQFGLSDVQIEPLMFSWRLRRFDLTSSASFWAPTGRFNQLNNFNFYNLGAGFWTYSFSLGATWYPDAQKTWAVSVLNHYDLNTAQYGTLYNVTPSTSHPLGIAPFATTPGDIYTLEWGISKMVAKRLELGLTGYYQQQVSRTEGPAPFGPTGPGQEIHVAGIGPELVVTFPGCGLRASLRYDYEFSAEDHPQGHLVNLTLTKSF
jgi:hypothetical protein